HELAFGITSDNARFGAVESPHGGMAGGSSGGSAAAVAGGLATMALGTDTGGSGRLPAAFCGCVGLRPTAGRYPGDGVLTLSPTLDTVSAMARDVAAIGRLDAVLAADGDTAPPTDAATLRLGRIADPFWTDLDPRAAGAAEAAIDLLEAAGATVEDREAPGLRAAIEAVAMPLVIAEARRWWAPFVRDRLGLDLHAFAARIASPDVAAIFAMVAADKTEDAALDALSRDGAGRVASILAAATDGLDALVHPTVPVAAPPLGVVEVEIDGAMHPIFPLLTGRAVAASLWGAPAISLPIPGYDARPLGLELLGHPGRDRALLSCAAAVEAALR
ncbi:MAG: amidase family protein, partial [Pseudomonadota bacterium]